MSQDTTVDRLLRSASNYVENIVSSFDVAGVTGDLFRIGRPINFPNRIDPSHRISRFMRSRMNIVDIVPCDFTIDFGDVGEKTEGDNSIDLSGLIPQITYSDAVQRYKNSCKSYGIDNKYVGLRLYTTDDTTANDSISNDFGENAFLAAINKLRTMAAPIRQFTESIGGTQARRIVTRQALGAAERTLGSAGTTAEEILGVDTAKLQNDALGDLKSLAGQVSRAAAELIMHGSRIELPKIWDNSTYMPSFTSVVRLVSPYGHPNAIKEFIIRPLIHLLLLSTPTTYDGISFNRPQTLSIQAYGINYTPLGIIQSINLRRGGADTSFNVYRQPLSIEASVVFQFLTNGIAHFDGGVKSQLNYDENIFSESQKPFEKSRLLGNTSKATIHSVGRIVTSLKPITPEEKEYLEEGMEEPRVAVSTKTPTQSETSAQIETAKNSNTQMSQETSTPSENIYTDSWMKRGGV